MKEIKVVAAIIQKENKILATKRGYGEFIQKIYDNLEGTESYIIGDSLMSYEMSKTFENEVNNRDSNENKYRIFKNGDIYKMHTYKDSILKTEGSYVLYPGNVHKLFKEDNDLIIPSVGAFPLAPGNGGEEEYNLSIFIKNVIRSLIVN